MPAEAGQHNMIHRIAISSADTVNFSALDGIVDHHKAIRSWHDPLVYAKALMSFAEECQPDADDMERLLMESPDKIETARTIAHALKGVAGNLCITRVAEQAIRIDASLKAHQRDEALGHIKQLGGFLTEFIQAMAKVHFYEEGSPTVRHAFDPEAVQTLFAALSFALDQLNPDVVEPILAQLSGYLPGSDLMPIKRAVDAFDFESGKEKLSRLAATLGCSPD